MKQAWIKRRLADVTTKIGSGATPLGGEAAYKKEGIALFRSLNVYDDGFRESGLARIDDNQAARLSNVVVEPNDILLNITGASVARCCVAPANLLPARVNQHVSIIRPLRGILDSKFLHYLLVAPDCKMALLSTGEEGGSTRQAITKAQLQNFVIEFPESLSEQQRIVGILDEAFEGIATAKAAAEKNLQNARALFESHLQSAFTQRGKGWEEERLDAFYDIGSSKRVLKSEWKAHGVPFYRGREITRLAADGFVDNELFISEKHFEELSKKSGVPQAGDIVITAIGTIGNAHIVRESDRFYFKDASVLWMKRRSDVRSEFVRFWLKSALFFDQLDRGNGATVDTLTIQKLQSVRIQIPKPSEQKKIVEQLHSLSSETQRLERIYEQKLAELEALKKSLLHQAFTGQL